MGARTSCVGSGTIVIATLNATGASGTFTFTAQAVAFTGATGKVGRHVIDRLLRDPRFGLAYDPFGDGKTAIRASFGVFHAANQGGQATGDGGGSNFSLTRTVYNSTLDNSLFATTPLTGPISVSGPDPNDSKRACSAIIGCGCGIHQILCNRDRTGRDSTSGEPALQLEASGC